ncbi:flagellar hook-basal body protein [Andreprevotia sp. IGB-42]|uniref:flagellar hook-basal body protein n=1 Tax=Andreprevotia sp. IGB-42 TaxID=2497473 RepID=UPI001359009F|nr:flagellar hook basal-body protein [Andreprevotia sp. IGB-42]
MVAQTMQLDSRRVETYSHNMVNSTTPGYRRQISLLQPQFASVFDSQSQAGNAVDQRFRTAVDMTAGTMKPTGRALDLAISGDAYFTLEGPQGVVYTRRGDFQVDASGKLVSADGEAVMSTQGELRLPPGKYTVDASGRISVDGNVAGQLQLVQFDPATQLIPVGNASYTAAGKVPVTSVVQADVRSGYLEVANVSTAAEMVGLLETMRHFEANQKLFQNYDDAISKAIQKLGEF